MLPGAIYLKQSSSTTWFGDKDRVVAGALMVFGLAAAVHGTVLLFIDVRITV